MVRVGKGECFPSTFLLFFLEGDETNCSDAFSGFLSKL